MRQVVLPEPEGPEHGQELAALDVEVEVLDDEGFAIVALLYVREPDEGFGRPPLAAMPSTSPGGESRNAARMGHCPASPEILHRDDHEQQYQYRRNECDTDPVPGVAQYVQDRPSHFATSILVTGGAS